MKILGDPVLHLCVQKILLQVYYSNFRLDLFSIQFTKKEAPQKFLGRGYFTSTTWNLNGKLCPKHFEYNAPSLCWAQCSKNPTKIRKIIVMSIFFREKKLEIDSSTSKYQKSSQV